MPKEPSARSAKSKGDAAVKGKGKKDPNAPKRGLSAYMFFSQDWRERVKAENPDATFGEIGKLLGAKWKELDEDDKAPYKKQAEEDKKRAETEKAEYEGGSSKPKKASKAEKAEKAEASEEAADDGDAGDE